MNPYQPPPVPPYMPGYAGPVLDPAAQLLAPARRAGILMIVLGILSLLCGGFALLGSGVSFDQLSPEQAGQMQEFERQIKSMGLTLKTFLMALAVVGLAIGALFVAFGIWVRRGTKPGVIASIVLTGLLMLELLREMAMGAGAGPGAAQGIVMVVAMLGVLGLLMTWLMQAFKAAPLVAAMRSQQAGQYGLMQQGRQMFQGSAFMVPPPPPPGEPPVGGPPPRR